ncbi:MAG: Pyridoxamine 5'-phosphate oxidase [Candidatus Methanofastidiosum methylothiophilum]|uniref:Pyridoxamine 5'-phosphate oxidase n=1 Tax=Candidatus Methanofastidiosum methylothiophilum TaxID=1705564 RepID=A0A150J8R3_9EURY|nr:MAG: Pyridoxamine 5'-phosphate oxidase [Candidatus Methanofastidiosum methylthiophilus]NMC77601.1 pyridoxamine 5'-phosphate oxidase family protein [Candidatus Methanofastidiosa archaeon]
MNRKDREISDLRIIEEILCKSKVLRLALCNNNFPYIVPLNFGYKDNHIYIHSSKKGMKIDMLKKNNNVAFEVDTNHELLISDKACGYSMKYESVIGFGKAFLIENNEEKKEALDIIMSHYAKGNFDYSLDEINRISIIRIDIDSMSGKKS